MTRAARAAILEDTPEQPRATRTGKAALLEDTPQQAPHIKLSRAPQTVQDIFDSWEGENAEELPRPSGKGSRRHVELGEATKTERKKRKATKEPQDIFEYWQSQTAEDIFEKDLGEGTQTERKKRKATTTERKEEAPVDIFEYWEAAENIFEKELGDATQTERKKRKAPPTERREEQPPLESAEEAQVPPESEALVRGNSSQSTGASSHSNGAKRSATIETVKKKTRAKRNMESMFRDSLEALDCGALRAKARWHGGSMNLSECCEKQDLVELVIRLSRCDRIAGLQ